jgi:hypothetical protein
VERWVSLRFPGSLEDGCRASIEEGCRASIKKYFIRKGFLNSRQNALSREVGNGFSQTQASTVDFDHNREIDVWEKAFLERLPVEWVMDKG